jgi:hypothetical protein
MEKLLIICVVLALSTLSVAGQQQQQPAKLQNEATTVSPEMQRTFRQAQKEVELAQSRLEAVQSQAQALVFQIMALLKLSPSEYKAVLNKEGELQFEKIAQAPNSK